MLGLGFAEIALISLVIVLFFGAKKLPGLAEAIGKSVKSFKKGLNAEEEQKKLDNNDTSDKK